MSCLISILTCASVFFLFSSTFLIKFYSQIYFLYFKKKLAVKSALKWYMLSHTHTHVIINLFLITNKFTSRLPFRICFSFIISYRGTVGTIVNAAAGWLRIGKKSNAQLIGGNCCMLRIKTRLIFIVGLGESKVTRRKWSTTHTKWNIYVTHPHPDGCLSKTYPYVCLCVCVWVCVQCTYLPYITHTLRFVVCARVCVVLFAFSLLRF